MSIKELYKKKEYSNEHPKAKEKKSIGEKVMSHGIQIFDSRLGERDKRLNIKNIIKSFKNIKLNKDFFK